MPSTQTAAAERIRAEFAGAWRDDTPIFGCCTKSVAAATADLDLLEVATQDVTTRVQALRAAVEAERPGHLATHRCCAGHLADLAFDLPALVRSVSEEADERDEELTPAT